MIPQFPQGQDRDGRIQLIREVVNQAAAELEAELTGLFQACEKPLVLTRLTYPPEWSKKAGQPIPPIVVYDAGEADFRAEPDDSGHIRMRSQMITAPMVSHGLLLDLLEMNHLRKNLGIAMTKGMATSFKNSHLTTIQEFLALGKWQTPAAIIPNHRATAGKKDVDWRFDVGATPVLLEVKFRRTDWRRGHPETEKFNSSYLFDSIEGKFPDASAGFLRVAHIILVQPIDREVLQAADDFTKSPMVDAVILDPLSESNGAGMIVIGRKADFVRTQIKDCRVFPKPNVVPIIFRRPSK